MSFTLVVRGVFVEASGSARLFGTRTSTFDDGSGLTQRAPEDAVFSALARALAAIVAPRP